MSNELATAEASLCSLQSTVALPAPLPAPTSTATATPTCNSCNKTSSKVAAKGKSKPEINSDKLLISPADSRERDSSRESVREGESQTIHLRCYQPQGRSRGRAEGGRLA